MTADERALLQASIDAMTEWLAEMNLNLVVSRDFHALKAFQEAEGAYVINWTFHPDIVFDGSLDAFWLRVEDQDGRVVACHADRVFETDDFYGEWTRTGRIWTGVKGPDPYRDDVVFHDIPERLSGVVSHSGSMRIVNGWRKRGISALLAYLSRSIHMRNYGTTFHTGYILQDIADTNVWDVSYGYPRAVPMMTGYWPVMDKNVHLKLCWIDRAESIEAVRALPHHPQSPVDIPLLRGEGEAQQPSGQWTQASEATSTALT